MEKKFTNVQKAVNTSIYLIESLTVIEVNNLEEDEKAFLCSQLSKSISRVIKFIEKAQSSSVSKGMDESSPRKKENAHA